MISSLKWRRAAGAVTFALAAGLCVPALAQMRTPPQADEPVSTTKPLATPSNEAAAPKPTTEFGRIEERINGTISAIRESAANLNEALDGLDGGMSADKARQIDSRIGEIMIAAQSALDVAGNNGMLADRLARAAAMIEADETRIDALGQTEEQKKAMRERIAVQHKELKELTDKLAKARQTALEKVNETVQLRPIIAWYARREQTDAVTAQLKPLIASVNELANSLDTLVKLALKDATQVPN
jgi:hypothetical protein